MERLIRAGLLYDFYGGLLTEKQRKALELYYYEDWSLSEIAEKEGVSRQAIHDLIQRSEKIMEEFETKLGLMERFLAHQEILRKISSQLNKLIVNTPQDMSTYSELTDIQQNLKLLIEE